MLLGYAPEITPEQAANLNVSDDVLRSIKRRLYHRYLSAIMEDLNDMASRGDLLLYVNGDIRRLRPFVSYFINDHPEGQLICLVFDSGVASRPCRACLTLKCNLHQWDNIGQMRLMGDVRRNVEKWCLEVEQRSDQLWRKKNHLPEALYDKPTRPYEAIENDARELSLHLDKVCTTRPITSNRTPFQKTFNYLFFSFLT